MAVLRPMLDHCKFMIYYPATVIVNMEEYSGMDTNNNYDNKKNK